MRELDLILLGWLGRHYAQAGAERRAQFEALLEQPDPQLAAWLLYGEPAPAQCASLIGELRGDIAGVAP